ncbi:motility protein A [Microbaculum marinisediminis]|uniref:MotA/TolQ/ExbB proton channel family protein n=1 Tax=Microbaculum marinisediminis TaxID=2931392 RepID=A0AAW5QYB0_9HYPH|nr:MotA/TolQ/ExbB proton channel family protein [Microbaculum sp. A6E488]MCT8971633.1 MotA/TolQ/ExbB proton channel family protein [Microbaculum sp. A6E488]
MDIATILGILFGTGVVGAAIFVGGDVTLFTDLPSMLIVLGGAMAATIIRFPITGVLSALALGGRVAFTHRKIEPRQLIDEIAKLAEVVRKQGPLGLENVEVDDEFLAKGMQYIADGYDPVFIRESLERERDLNLERLEDGQRVFKAIGDSAPAFGMIGTLVGLVQMLANMDDPATIGPAMAIALLTTLYGALIANLIALPIADKLALKSKVEEVNQTLVLDGIMQIRDSKSPALIREMLIAYLPEKHRGEMAEPVPA